MNQILITTEKKIEKNTKCPVCGYELDEQFYENMECPNCREIEMVISGYLQ